MTNKEGKHIPGEREEGGGGGGHHEVGREDKWPGKCSVCTESYSRMSQGETK